MHDRDPRLRVGLNVLDLCDLADLLFELPGDQILAPLGSHPGEVGRDQGLPDHDGGIFLAGVVEEGRDARRQQRDQGQHHESGVVEREVGDAHRIVRWGYGWNSFTFWPSTRKWTPATAMTSPYSTPSVTATQLSTPS